MSLYLSFGLYICMQCMCSSVCLNVSFYPSVFLSICLYECDLMSISLYLSIYLYVCVPLSVSTCLSICLCFCISDLSVCVFLSICLSAFVLLLICLFAHVCLSLYLTVYLCLSVYFSTYPSTCLPVCLLVSLSPSN